MLPKYYFIQTDETDSKIDASGKYLQDMAQISVLLNYKICHANKNGD